MNHDNDLSAALDALASSSPAAPALTTPGRAPTSFDARVAQRARTTAVLRALGIARGDVVAWCNGDRAQTAAALATLPDACTLAPLSTSATRDVLRDLVRRLDAKAIVVPSRHGSAAEDVAIELGVATLVADDGGRREAGAFDLAVRQRTRSLDRARRWSPAWAHVSATSGSTGRPKLVPQGHRQVIRTSRVAGAAMGMGPGDASGHIMPLHLTGGMRTAFFQSLLVGGSTCVLPEADIDALVAAIAAGEVSYVSASFTMQRELLARVAAGARVPRGRLRFVRVSSGRMADDEMDALERALGVPVVTGLASSETGTTAQQTLDRPRKRGSVGRVLDSEVRLCDADGRVVGTGEVGEIQVRGPQVFDGYVDDEALTAASFVDGYFRMGDLARFDADGDLYVVGRVKDVINRGGDKIAPLEIDEVLRSLPGVAEAAAFGVPHARLGEEVVAAVVMQPGATRDADGLLDAVRERLGARRAPRRLWFVDALPRTDVGKVRRAMLPEWVGYVAAGGDAPASGPAAASPIETALAALWSGVLARGEVSRDATFQALGGDDDRAARLCAQVADVFGVEIAARALRDEASTVAAMARVIEERRVGGV